MELEKPQPEQIVTDFETEFKIPIAAVVADETASESPASKSSHDSAPKDDCEETLPPGTIQAREERADLCERFGLPPSRRRSGQAFAKEPRRIGNPQLGARATLFSRRLNLLQRGDAGVAGVDGGYRASHHRVGEGAEIARSGLVGDRGRGNRGVSSGGSAVRTG